MLRGCRQSELIQVKAQLLQFSECAWLYIGLQYFDHLHSPHPGNAGKANMSTLCRSALLACFVALMAAFAFASHVEARQGYGGFFWSGPYYQPSPWRQRYYSPPPKRHYAPSRKRKVVRSEQRRFSKSPKRRVALAVPGAGAAAAASVQISINKVSQKMTSTVGGVE